jgi:hypothetical protein
MVRREKLPRVGRDHRLEGAAADRARARPVGADEHPRAHRARRGAGRPHDRREGRAASGGKLLEERLEDLPQ